MLPFKKIIHPFLANFYLIFRSSLRFLLKAICKNYNIPAMKKIPKDDKYFRRSQF